MCRGYSFFTPTATATPSSSAPPPCPPPKLKVLYKTQQLAVIDKPHKMLVHRSPIDKRETVFAVQTLRDQLDTRVYPIHRLDKATSGALMFALDALSASTMGQLWEDKTKVKKTYIALVRGWVDIPKLKSQYYHDPSFARVWYDDDVRKSIENLDDPNDPNIFTLNYPLPVIDEKTGNKTGKSQDAVTSIKVLGKCELPFACGKFDTVRYSLVELGLQTGRKHQLRKHLHHLNHHIIGDTKHGDLRQNKAFYENVLQNERQMFLRAKRLQFEDPWQNKFVDLDAGLGENWERLAEAVPHFKPFLE
eukprot:CAMPEP_0118956324 /NCGR_PEP_ID=MMETSP1169-20130426/61505_1 /TAXON_ID=36882 /ORGANISM="Pyramimonas obovata, Strain CCMP722" /LENGTH=304 /DNA_ID=CAMNT_0006904341 /DNA_START=1 /DNA_END=915 /DNA_ORIENTATION=-